MRTKIVPNAPIALADIKDGDTIMIGGFGEAGSPIELIHALIDTGATNLIVINNNTGSGEVGLAALIKEHRVAKMICSYPKTANSTVFPKLYHAGEIELELVPQGTLAERIRAGGSGIPAFYTPASVGTPLSDGKEIREIKGRNYVLEYGLTADFSLIKAKKADMHGNLLYNKTARNFAPLMAMAGKITIVQAQEIVDLGQLEPETIVTPGIFVQRLIQISAPVLESTLVADGATYP